MIRDQVVAAPHLSALALARVRALDEIGVPDREAPHVPSGAGIRGSPQREHGSLDDRLRAYT